MASTVIYRNSVSSGHNKFTFSAWVKRSAIATSKTILGMYNNNDQRGKVRFGYSTDNKLYVWLKNAVGTEFNWYSNREFRDCNGYYHIVVAIDTTQSTASDRCKVYVNGEQLTGNTSGQDIVQNSTTMIFGHSQISVGNSYYNGSWESQYFDGIMSHVHCCYGYAYQASDFGYTDSTTGEWTINTVPSVSYGTNGFFILKDGNSTTDQSGNNISLTTNGTLTNTEDNPSNLFCTINPLQLPQSSETPTLSFGNTKYAGDSSAWQRVYGTIGANTGKYYYEFKCLNSSGAGDALRVGWDSIDSINSGTDSYYSGLTLDRDGKLRGGEDGYNNYDPNAVQMTAAYSGGNFSFTTGDILGMAIDIDNNTFSVYKNGNLEINAYSYASASNCSLLKSKGHFIAPSVNWFSSSGNGNRSCFNFGNGYFETTAISSEGTNASGIGKFEYDVPTGYTAFSTKGLNE